MYRPQKLERKSNKWRSVFLYRIPLAIPVDYYSVRKQNVIFGILSWNTILEYYYKLCINENFCRIYTEFYCCNSATAGYVNAISPSCDKIESIIANELNGCPCNQQTNIDNFC